MSNLEEAVKISRILIVDGEPAELRATSQLLREAGYEVTEASMGEEGLRLTEQTKPHLVLLDVVLPDMDGLEMCRRIKADTELANIFVALLSGMKVNSASQAEGLEGGADEFISRPIPDQELLARVRAMLRIKRAEDALRESEHRYRSIVEQSLDGIRLIDEKGTIIEWNETCEQIMGLKRTQVLGLPIWEVLHQLMPNDRKSSEAYQRFKSATLEFLSTGQTPLRSEGPVYTIQHPDGTPRFVEERVFPITTDRGILGCGIVRDVTQQVQAQRELQRSEERYAMAQRAANIGSWDWDIQTGNLHWSDQIEPMFGFDRGEFGRTYEAFLECIHPEDRQQVIDAVNACIEEGDDYAVDHRIVWPDGTIRWVTETGNVTRNESGEAVRMLGVVLDITERKGADDELRRLSRVVEQSPSIVVITDTKGDIEYVNPKFTEITGYSAKEVLGKNPCILKSGEQGLEFYKDLWATILAGDEWRGEFVNKKKNGELYWEAAIMAPIRNAARQTTHFVKLAEDITQRVRAQQALRASEERYRRLLELSFDGIGIHSEGKIEFINSTGAKLLGADSPEQLIGKPIDDFIHPDYRETVQRRQMHMEQGQAAPLVEEIFIRLDGSHLNVEVTAIATSYRGRPAVQVVFRDISERKRAELALRSARDAADAARREEEVRRQEAEQRRLIAESLADVLIALNSEQSLDEVLDLIATQTRQLLGTRAVAIFSQNSGGEAPSIRAAQGLSAGYSLEAGPPIGYDALRQAVDSRQPVAIPDGAAVVGPVDETEHSAISPSWAERYRAWLAVPIMVKNEADWAMLLYYAEPRSFSDDEAELATLLGNQVALAVENDWLRAKSKEAARAAERNRLARELHDAVTQVLFSASLIAETVPRIWERDPEKGQHGLDQLSRLIQGALAEMRTLLLELRPDALKEQRLDMLIRQLTDGLMARTRIPVTITVTGDCSLPPEVKLALYRIVQEALNNVVKHALASQASVYLECQPDQVTLRVSDDGCGFASEGIEPHKLGIGIMRERAKAIGARFALESQRDQGTHITVTWENTEYD